MSDEERKALEQLNKRYEFFKENPLATNVWLSLDVYNLGTILNLIKKQSKEIEELNKENTRQHELIGNIHQKWKDKIKAKIKEWDKDIKWNNADDHYYAIKMMQSLLEKE